MEEKKANNLTLAESKESAPIELGKNSNKKTNNVKTKSIRTKITAIIASVLSALICVLLFIDGFFSYTATIIVTGMSVDRFSQSFWFLTDSSLDSGFLFTAIIIVALVIIIIASWIKIKRGLRVICSATALIVLIIGTIVGKSNFYYSDYLNSLGAYLSRDFYSLGVLFYIEIVLLIALLVVCFWEELKIIKTASMTKKEAVTENQATLSRETTTVVQVASPAEEIKKYKELLDSGIISQEEFDSKKNQLLGI